MWSSTRTKHTTGEITNYISVDAQGFLDTIPYICIMWATPYQVVLTFIFLYLELGMASLVGVVSAVDNTLNITYDQISWWGHCVKLYTYTHTKQQ